METALPIHISSDTLRVQVFPRGAALAGVRLAGQNRNLVLGFVDPDDPATLPIFAGPLVGPIANRVRDGRVDLNEQSYQMPLNEGGRTTLHSGPDGLHAQDWDIVHQTTDTVTLCTILPNGCNGLPGNRKFRATYQVEQSTLRLTITATTDQPTPINVAAHPYWNLDGRPDVSGHLLRIEAAQYLPTDDQNLPTGRCANVKETQFDFTQDTPVPLAPDLDVNFCLADKMHDAPRLAATLTGADGTVLALSTNTPGIQVYNGACLQNGGPQTSDFPPLAPYCGIALEPQHWPDALHHRHFPSPILLPGETYCQITEYCLTID